MPFSWNDLEKSIVVENLALPQQIDEGLILNSLVTNAYDYSLVYNLTQDIETYNSNTFDANVAKEFMIESCAEF